MLVDIPFVAIFSGPKVALSVALSAPRAMLRASCSNDGTARLVEFASSATDPYRGRLSEEASLVSEALLPTLCRRASGPRELAARGARDAAILRALSLGGAVITSKSTGRLLGRWHVSEGVKFVLSPAAGGTGGNAEMDDMLLLEVASLLADPDRDGVLCECPESELPLRARAVKGGAEMPKGPVLAAPDNGGLLVRIVRQP